MSKLITNPLIKAFNYKQLSNNETFITKPSKSSIMFSALDILNVEYLLSFSAGRCRGKIKTNIQNFCPVQLIDLQNLSDRLTLFKPWEADYVRHNIYCRPPGFKMLSTPLIWKCRILNFGLFVLISSTAQACRK